MYKKTKHISKAVLLLAMGLTQVKGFAQTLLRTKTGADGAPSQVMVSVDNTTLSNATSQVSKPGSKTPRKIVWIEYGDGQFTTSAESEHSFYDNEQSNFPVMLVKSTGIYDKGGKPPRHSAKKIPPAAKTKKYALAASSVFYSRNEHVRITTNAPDVQGGDTMMVALSYRRPPDAPPGTYYLLFFYNMEGMEVFEPMKPGSAYSLYNDEGEMMKVPYLRTHFGEELIAPKKLPGEWYDMYRRNFKWGHLVFTMNMNDDREKHIFLTLVPRKNITGSENMQAAMDAVLIPPDKKPRTFNYASRLVGQLASHDPNWQEVFPKCIVLPKKNQEMKHHIHFQNTGLGPAKRVTVKTAIPTGLTAQDIEVTGWSVAGQRNNPDFQLKIDRSRSDSIVFDFTYDPRNTRIVLYGAIDLADAPVNPKTMGDIYFTVRAKPGTPNIMTSGTAIYFDDNEAVLTEETRVEFKKCCDCDKDCDKYKNRFMKWLLCKDC
jgi:hypothetical protein